MPVKKVLGVQLMEFYREWPMGDDWYLAEDEEGGELVSDGDGNLHAEPTKKYDPRALGVICWQGRGGAPEFVAINGKNVLVEHKELDVAKAVWAWIGTDSLSFVVTISKGDEQRFLARLSGEKDWKVSRVT